MLCKNATSTWCRVDTRSVTKAFNNPPVRPAHPRNTVSDNTLKAIREICSTLFWISFCGFVIAGIVQCSPQANPRVDHAPPQVERPN